MQRSTWLALLSLVPTATILYLAYTYRASSKELDQEIERVDAARAEHEQAIAELAQDLAHEPPPAPGFPPGDEFLVLPGPTDDSPPIYFSSNDGQKLTAEQLLELVAPLAAAGEREEGYEATEDGLYAATLGRYLDEGFLNLTREEALDFIPIDAAEAELAHLPGRLESLLAEGLPTRDDVARGFRSETVRTLLRGMQDLDLALVELDMVPLEKRPPGSRLARQVETAHLVRDELALELMAELERVTGYPHWTLLHRAREAWGKPRR